MERTASESAKEDRQEQTHRDTEREGDDGQVDDDRPGVASLHRSVGNQAVQELHERGELQAKLAVSQPTDRSEREAERVAEAVVSQDNSATERRGVDAVDRQTSGGTGATVDGETEAEIRSVTSGGRPLSASERSFFEPRFGQDFSDVRVHTGPEADEAARSINAEAFTIGSDIAFARGNYQPGTRQGKELLAHELTHVVQQTSGVGRTVVRRQTSSATYDTIKQKLSYGITDWAVTDSNARDVLKTLRGLPEAKLKALVHQMDRDGILSRLLNNTTEAIEQKYYPIINKIKYIRDYTEESQKLSQASMDMLERIDTFLSQQAQVFVDLVGTAPWVNLALSNPLETLAGMVAAQSLSPLPGNYAEAVKSAKEIVGGKVQQMIARFYLRHENSLSQKEKEFWKGMRNNVWAP